MKKFAILFFIFLVSLTPLYLKAHQKYELNKHYETEYHIWTLRSIIKTDSNTICKWQVTNKAEGSWVHLGTNSCITDLETGEKYMQSGSWGIAEKPDTTIFVGETCSLMYYEVFPVIPHITHCISLFDEEGDGFDKIILSSCLDIANETLEKETQGDSLVNAAAQYYLDDDIDTAIELSKLARDAYISIGNKYDYASATRNLSAYNIDSLEIALQYTLEADSIYNSLPDSDNDKLLSKRSLFALYQALENESNSILYGEKYLSQVNSVQLWDKNDAFHIALNVSEAYNNACNYSKAASVIETALDFAKNIWGEESYQYALTCFNAYGKFIDSKQILKAKYYAETAKILLEDYVKIDSLEYINYYIRTSIDLSSIYYELGDYKSSYETAEVIIKDYESLISSNLEAYACALNLCAMGCSSNNNAVGAIKYGRIFLNYAEQLYGKDTEQYNTGLVNLATYYGELGNYEKVMELSQQAIEIASIIDDSMTIDHSLLAISYCFDEEGDHHKAIEMALESLKMKEIHYGKESEEYASALYTLSDLYRDDNQYQKSIDYGLEALNLREQLLGKNHPVYALSLNNLSATYSELGNLDQALCLSKEAYEIRKSSLGEDHLWTIWSLGNVSRYLYDNTEFEKAYQTSIDVVKRTKSNVSNNFLFLPNTQRSYYWNMFSDYFYDTFPSIFYSVNQNDASEIYDNVLFSKGLLLSTEVDMQTLIRESRDKRSIALFNDLRSNKFLYDKMLLSPVEERIIDCDSLRMKIEKQEEELVAQSQIFGDYTNKLRVSWKDIQNSLSQDDIAIEFFSFPLLNTDSVLYCAMTLKKEYKYPLFCFLCTSKQIESINSADYYTTDKIENLIWKPILNELDGIKNIYFSPDGNLFEIAIENLSIVSNYNCYRLSSTREILTKGNAEDTQNAVIFGGLNYDESIINRQEYIELDSLQVELFTYNIERVLESDSLLRSGVHYLPSSLDEVLSVSTSLSQKGANCSLYKGVEGTEKAFKELSGKKNDIIHISTHGFYWNSDKASLKTDTKFLDLLNDRKTSIEDKSLTRSGLLLAGANKALQGDYGNWEDEDGILTAKEISQLDLSSVNLVVLSACQTGLGDIGGEGVFGLQRGFKKAGVKSIIMSLWKVNDTVTSILMKQFYRALLSRKSKSESLKLAQDYVKNYTDDTGNNPFSDPYYWAAWVLLDGNK